MDTPRVVESTRAAWDALPSEAEPRRDGPHLWIHPTVGELVARIELAAAPQHGAGGVRWRL